MPVTVVVGAQWGDEGKGKIVDILSAKMDYVARSQGGANAGHTINLQGEQYILHLVPSGILHPHTNCVIGNGVVVDPIALLEEFGFLSDKGIEVNGRLFISDRAHVIFSYHKTLDQMRESDSSQQKIGTTGRGIGPAYVDKVNRTGIRMIDLMNEKILEMKLKKRIREINQLLQWKKVDQSINESEMLDEYLRMAEIIKPFITDTSVLLNDAIVNNKKVLMEGAQGTLLDVDHGTYPFVTSSNPVSAGACTGCGIGPQKIDNIIGVLKAYTTRVGEGPFPTELRGEEGKYLREVGKEYGATTGRPRRCGWFDAVIARYSVRINGLTSLAITKMDVLDQVEKIKVCTHYNCEGDTFENFPASIEKLSKCEPGYVDLPGWKMEIENIQSFEDLPENAQKYIEYIERVTGVPVNMISVGARRKSTIFK